MSQINKKRILKNKYYLYLTEFFSGMSVMAVELGASRLLAPYFSSSQIVWTIIIGTIMIAMALGNIYGGRAADKNPNPDILYRRILVAAIWIAAIPVVGKYIVIGISALFIFSVSNGFLVLAAFVSCMVIFVFPLFLLGTVTPSLVKYTVDSLDESGSTVGKLNASNTIGSIIGTFVPTFITIPSVGTSVSFLIFAGILLLLAAAYFISERTGKIRIAVGLVLVLLCCTLGAKNSFAFWESNLSYEGESVYNYLQVKETEQSTILSTNVLFGVQSIYYKDKQLTGMYYDYAMAAPYMAGFEEKTSLDVLVLGMGSGTFATQCRRYFGEEKLNITGVEIDEKITGLAREKFGLPEDTKVVTYDGRAYLGAVKDKYDVIMVDAYQDITIPFQMSSVEFFREVKEHLNPDGVMVVNMNMRTEEDEINRYLSDTISSVFGNVYTIDVENSTNRELFASDNPQMMERFEQNMERSTSVDMNLKNLMRKINFLIVEYTPGNHVMTDNQAPVELLGMRAIDALIEDEVAYYKKIYAEKGIRGVIERL